MNSPKTPLGTEIPSSPTTTAVKLVEVKVDRVDLPPSVAGNAFNNIMFGPMAGQPSKAAPNDGSRKSSTLFWAIMAIVLFCIYYFRSTDPASPKNTPPPQSRPAWP